MYGNNFGYPFMGGMPNQIVPPMTGNMMGPMIGAPLRSGGGGLRSLLGLGRMSTGTSGFNFASLLNGASKTLGVVKDAIPVVKEVGPMMNNMRSMLKIASVFKDETDTTKKEDTTSELDKSFFTSSLNFGEDDFEKIASLTSNLKKNNVLLKLLVLVVLIAVTAGIIFLVYNFIK